MIILSFIIATILFFLLLPLLLHKTTIEIFYSTGNSMTPVLPSGTMYLIQKSVISDEIKNGDIVTLKSSNLPSDAPQRITHRVIDSTQELIYIQGDNVSEPDGWFSRTDVEAKSIEIYNQPLYIPCSYKTILQSVGHLLAFIFSNRSQQLNDLKQEKISTANPRKTHES